MAITAPQIPGTLITVASLQNQLGNLSALLNQATNLINAGWVINIGSSGSPINISVTAPQQAQLVALYDAIKTQLVTTFQQLP